MPGRTILTAFLVLLAVISCQQEPEQGQLRQPENTGAIPAIEEGQSQPVERIPTDQEILNLFALEDRILQQPDDRALRRALGEAAADVQAGIIWTAGRAKIKAGAPSPAIARSFAEQAAFVDASRWAAYILEWLENDYATEFGKIQGRVPGGKIVKSAATDSSVVVVVNFRIP